MTPILLTEEQRRALQAQPGQPVGFLDPTTQKRFVLLPWEQYERVRALVENGPPQAAPAVAVDVKPLRQPIRDLPLPPQVGDEAMRYCKRLGVRRAKERHEVEEQMKLQHYYGGTWIAFLDTNEGVVVVAAAHSLSDPLFDRQLAFLTHEERRRCRFDCPSRLFDEESQILTPFTDEG